jgi:glycosyltransferase involved in cell wall biosynthesis
MAARVPAVTVVVVTRDRPRLLADALASVAAQRVPPLEVRIGNDGDSDVSGALRALEGAGGRTAPREARIEREADSGARVAPGAIQVTVVRARAGQPGAARNCAARGASGEALAFLDDDDRWLPGHLEALATALADPALDLVFRDSAIVREALGADGARIERERRVIARDWDPGLMRHDDFIPPSAWLVRRSFFERLGGFDESFRFSEDWDFLMRSATLTTPHRVPGVSVEIRMREAGNASADFGPERVDCLRRLAARHGLPPLAPKTFWEVAEAVAVAGRAHGA